MRYFITSIPFHITSEVFTGKSELSPVVDITCLSPEAH
jgi:hypothetical protein